MQPSKLVLTCGSAAKSRPEAVQIRLSKHCTTATTRPKRPDTGLGMEDVAKAGRGVLVGIIGRLSRAAYRTMVIAQPVAYNRVEL